MVGWCMQGERLRCRITARRTCWRRRADRFGSLAITNGLRNGSKMVTACALISSSWCLTELKSKRTTPKAWNRGPGNGTTSLKKVHNQHLSDLCLSVSLPLLLLTTFVSILNVWPSWTWIGPEYGTMEDAWKGVLVESDRLSEVHMKIQDHLSEDVPNQIRLWQKDAYHKVLKPVFFYWLTRLHLHIFSVWI